jgi:threonine dehydrogenase-like Zn-dependent dehydrogenase
MQGAVLYGPRDVRFEKREVPKITKSTDAVIRISSACVCGSDLWPYRGIAEIEQPTPMGHEYCGIVEEVGKAVKSVKPGQFVIGSFFASDNTCPTCQIGYQSSCRLDERQYLVEEIVDQWYGTQDVFYKVRADDGNLYILRRETSTSEGAWHLVSLRQMPPER